MLPSSPSTKGGQELLFRLVCCLLLCFQGSAHFILTWCIRAGGVLFAVAEVLLVAAVTVAGIAVAFPVAVGLNSVNSYAILK